MESTDPSVTGVLNTKAITILLIVLGCLATAVYLVNFRLPLFVPYFSGKSEIRVYLFLFLVLSILYLSAVGLVLAKGAEIGNSRWVVGIVILFALLFRLCLVPAAPSILSSDMYRYVWDGRVQSHGINPYLYPPAAEELKELRDTQVFPEINRKNFPTIYPAGAQIFFRLFYLVTGGRIVGFKACLVFFDALALLMLAALLRAYGYNTARVVIYAWNPLVVFEIACSGHLEGLAVFFLVAAFLLHANARKFEAVIMVAIAAALKMYPALLLPSLLNRGERLKGILIFFGIIALLYLPYAGAGEKIIGFLPNYLHDPGEGFNLGIKRGLLYMLPEAGYSLLSNVLLLGLAAAGLIVLILEKEQLLTLRSAFFLVGLLLLFMPSALQPWYVLMIVPFLAFFPNPAWILFSLTVTLSYIFFLDPVRGMPTWVLLTEYLPLFTLLVAGFIHGRLAIRRDTGHWAPALLPGRNNDQ